MLAKIFGKKNVHPMADLKSAQALLDDLPRNDALKSVLYLSEYIESVGNHEDFRPADQFAVLSLLDETAQPYARKLAYEYFTLPDINVFHGNRLCMALEGLFRHTANAYYLMFSRYCNSASIKPQLLAVRVVRAMLEQLKYASVQYKPHEATVWPRFAQLYQHAEQHKYLETSLNLYPAFPEATSVMCESAKLLAWHVCGLYSQPPRSIHLTERIISQYGHSIVISANLSGQALFCFDLGQPLGPLRINLKASEHPLMRYFSLSGMQDGVEALIKTLGRNSVPQELHLGGFFPAEQVLEAARHILTYLVTPPLRNSKRLNLSVVLDVVKGYENVVLRCKEFGRESSELPSMQWLIENVSSGGFCAVISGRMTEGVRIGNLLGIQTPGVSHMGVAIVRNLLRDVEGRLRVGAEILANHVSEVNLLFSVGGGTGSGQSALWLHTKTGVENGTATLLMQSDTFSMQHSLKTHFEGRNYLLIPSELKKNDLDYDLARFRVVEQEEG